MIIGASLGTVLGGTIYAGLSVLGSFPSVTGECFNYLGINLPMLVPQTVDIIAGSFIIYVPIMHKIVDYGLTYNRYGRKFLRKTAENERARNRGEPLPHDENIYNPENLLKFLG